MARNSRGKTTEEAFKRAARTVIERQGFLRTTISDIAVEARRSSASFYNYFDTKEALLAHLADEFRDEVVQRHKSRYRRENEPRVAIEEMVRAYWTTYKDRLPELVGVFQVAMVDETFAERWREIRQFGIDQTAIVIRRAQKAGYSPGVDPRLAASALSSMLENFCYVWLAAGGDTTASAVDDEHAIATLAGLWYHAIYWTA